MTPNMGRTDRILRIVAAFVVGILLDQGVFTSPWTIIMSVLALVFFLTSVIGFCPLYYPFRFSTKKT